MKLLWGDLHNHCGITYGFGSLENAIRAARTQLDFCAFTGHAMWPDMYEKNKDTEFVVNFHQIGFQKIRDHWEEIRRTVAEANCGELVTFQGYEMHSCRYGDYHFISKEDHFPLIYRDSPGELVRDSGCQVIAIPHHIGYTSGYRGINWDAFDESISPVVEVYSKHGCAMSENAPFPYYHDMGPRDSHNTVYEGIRRGYRFGFAGSTDHHAGYPGSYGDGLVAVLAEEKSRESIFGALKARRTYAVTGDKIECMFSVNGEFFGGEVQGEDRTIRYDVTCEYWMDKIIVYKNLQPIHILNGELCRGAEELCDSGIYNKERYKIRMEMGWGNLEELFTWKGSFRVKDGKITKHTTYFRGRDVLAPSESEHYDSDSVNEINNYLTVISNQEAEWQCQTVRNKSALHAMTDHIVFEVEGGPRTQVTVLINGMAETHTIAELLRNGYTHHVKPYHAQAFKIHQAIPVTQYHFQQELHDIGKKGEQDVYHMEVYQKNGHCAFISPIFTIC